jgi:ribA/ribD-fused uncharacterized protein
MAFTSLLHAVPEEEIMKHVLRFADQYAFLSNFYPCEILVDAIIFPTVEHAFQASKTMDREVRIQISELSSPEEAKRFGRTVELRPDWEDVKLVIMKELLLIKFKQHHFMNQLFGTGKKNLVEGNNWNDRYWGVCKGEGLNHLGMLLMQIRTELRAER